MSVPERESTGVTEYSYRFHNLVTEFEPTQNRNLELVFGTNDPQPRGKPLAPAGVSRLVLPVAVVE